MLFFSQQQYLVYILSGVVLIFLVYLYSTGRKRMWLNRFGEINILQGFSRIPNTTQNIVKGLAVSVSFCGLCMVLIGPKWQTTEEYYEKEGMEIVFVLDVSLSMLADDVKPNRLQRAKIEMENLIKGLDNDYLGLVVFAGRAFSMLPYLTTDYDSIYLRILRMINENYSRFVPYGTNVGNALLLAIESFSREEREKVIIFLTDGEEQLSVRSQVAEGVKMLMERKDISVYLIGIGDPLKASPIPKKDKNGHVTGYEIDFEDNTIMTKPDPELLQEIADVTGGTYIHDATGDELKSIFEGVIADHRKVLGTKTRNTVKDVSQYFLGGALLLLVIFLLL
jgi:Ca-activated chloride channel family protein